MKIACVIASGTDIVQVLGNVNSHKTISKFEDQY